MRRCKSLPSLHCQ